MFESRVFDLGPVGVHQSGFMPTENSQPLHRRVNIRTLVPFSDLVGSSSRARETPLSPSLSLSHGPLVSIAPHALLSPTWKQISPPCLIAVSVHFIPSTAAVLFSWRAAIRNPSKYRDSISPLAPSLSCCDAAFRGGKKERRGNARLENVPPAVSPCGNGRGSWRSEVETLLLSGTSSRRGGEG